MEEETPKLGVFPYVIGGASFIPGIGVLFGVVAIVWGLVTNKRGGRKLAIVGGCGVAFSVVLYGALFYFGFYHRGGVYDDLRAQLSQSTISELVLAIEFYKAQNGQYPASLEELKGSLPKDSMVMIADPAAMNSETEYTNYYYERIDSSHYYLLGRGADRIPFTQDDIVPDVVQKPGSQIGFVVKPREES
jgi:hypothetical protein